MSGASSEKEKEKEKDKGVHRAWGILIFGIIGATATTFAITQVRRSVDWINSHLNRMQSSGGSWRTNTNRSNFSEEAWKRYNRRMQEEYEEELERVQRIRRMQSVFNRERNKHRRGYEKWREGNEEYRYVPRDDWYWKTENNTYHKAKPHSSHNTRTYILSHHYSILGLDRARTTPYTDAEIKTAFRTKAMECHPDQNQDNKEAAEEKFKEVMKSYEAIKQERNGGQN
ncbi:hypothetical protein LUZ60_006189 [Juncus effusus]|nr:hypothetical protein LUZ60_006189 [Juncus effusus]